jgi:hypothetical protein
MFLGRMDLLFGGEKGESKIAHSSHTSIIVIVKFMI